MSGFSFLLESGSVLSYKSGIAAYKSLKQLFWSNMYRRILSLFLCVITLISTTIKVSAEEPPKETELYAKSAVLMDADSGRILYEKNGHEAMANASTTKILTCILALENCDLDSKVTVSQNAASQPKVHLGMHEGQTFYLKDLLYGLMLESYNDCAVAIAEHIAGSTENFADMMNEKAKEIGCGDSYFITPNGLDKKDDVSFHHTTAADLAKIMRYCIKDSAKTAEFLEITRTGQYGFSDVEGTAAYSCYNHNAFLQMMDGALTGKTGFTGTAGYCYIGALERDGRTYIVALLACGWPNNKTYKWSDTKKLMTYGIENYRKEDPTQKAPDASIFVPIEVEGGQSGAIGKTASVSPVIEKYCGCTGLLLKEGEEIDIKYEISDRLYAPVKKGDFIGKVSYMLGDEVIGECCVVAGDDVEKIDFGWCMERVLALLWLS